MRMTARIPQCGTPYRIRTPPANLLAERKAAGNLLA